MTDDSRPETGHDRRDCDDPGPRCPETDRMPGARRSEMNSSRDISISFRILFMRPGPIVSPACTGTTVQRPSACWRK